MLRDGVFYDWRRVPKVVVQLDGREPVIRQSLKTDGLAEARAQRDVLEGADKTLCGSMLTEGGKSEAAIAADKAARARAGEVRYTPIATKLCNAACRYCGSACAIANNVARRFNGL
jgi:hypothetical protein